MLGPSPASGWMFPNSWEILDDNNSIEERDEEEDASGPCSEYRRTQRLSKFEDPDGFMNSRGLDNFGSLTRANE